MAGAAARDPSATRRLPSSGPILARAHTPVPPFRLCNAHAHTPSTNFTSAASAPSRRRASAAVGEVHRRPALFLPVHDFGPHVTLVDQGKLPQETSRAWSLGPRLPERRPSRRRRQASLLPPPLHPLARRHPPCVVSRIPSPISLLFALSGFPAGSPEQPRRPLTVPAAGEAQSRP
jgi:hypothetical protein